MAAIRLGPGRPRVWFTGKTRAEVAQKLNKALREREMGVLVGSSPKTAQYLRDWLEATRVRDRTREDYRDMVERWIVPAIGRVKLTELSVDDVQRLVNRIAKQGKVRTAIHVRATLSTALKAAMRRELVGRNVAQLAEPPQSVERDAEWLDAANAAVFIEAIEGHDMEGVFLLGIGLGMRPSEVLALRWADVDLERGVLRVRSNLVKAKRHPLTLAEPKTRMSRRTLQLPSRVVDVLADQRRRQVAAELAAKKWVPWDLVFSRADGSPLRLDTVRKEFYRLLRRAGLPRVRLYDATRHSFASILAEKLVHPEEARQILGHADIQTTLRIYTHVAPTLSPRATEAINEVLGRNHSRNQSTPTAADS